MNQAEKDFGRGRQPQRRQRRVVGVVFAFDRHWQVERGLSKGHGLGLAISRLFVEENGGSISISKGAGPESPAPPALDFSDLTKLPSMEELAAAEAAPSGPGVGAILHFTLPVAPL